MLNKKELRLYAASILKLSPDNGLLYVQSVKYIVCTAIKTIGNQPILILYFIPRERAAEGDYRPVWTMFQSQDDYITLEYKDGKSKWRTATFENLFPSNYLGRSCAFYSARDERRVGRYFKDEDAQGFAALIKAQDAYIAARRRSRQLDRERKILARMDGLPALPDGQEDWAHRNILPAYFFYAHTKKGIAKGTCSVCGHEITLENVKYNGEAVCPYCGRSLTMKPRGRIKRLYDRETCQVIQRTAPGELVVRILKVTAAYEGDGPVVYVHIHESARQFVSTDPDGNMKQERFYLSYHGILTDWKEGDRPTNMGRVTFEGETCGHVFCGNLPAELENTPWQYCPIVSYYQHDGVPIQMSPLLRAYLEHPRLEHLIKTGFYKLVDGLVYGCYPETADLDETQNRTHRILGVMAEDVKFLRELNAGFDVLKVYREYSQMNLKARQKLLLWQLEYNVKWNIMPILEHMTVHKFLRYADGQYLFLKDRKGEYGGQRYGTMQEVVNEYKDYLEMCEKQCYDMKNSFILYPADLQKAHDKVAKRIKIKADAKMRRDFKAAYKRIMGQLDFEQDGMKIVYPASLDDIVAEGNAQHHCVANYVDKVAAKKTMILFLRRCEAVSKPFYTVEVRGQKVVQVRGNSNQEPPPEVKKFMDIWERKVLHGRNLEMKAAA